MPELKDLVGEHVLDGVDFYTERQPGSYADTDDASVCRFRLDGVVYCAIEDPSDGYRSCMRELAVGSKDRMKNVFPAIRVIGRYVSKDEDSYNEHDILELVDAITGRVVLEVGTHNADDYYPSFVANFDPTAMSTNIAVVEKEIEDTRSDAERYKDNPYFGRFG